MFLLYNLLFCAASVIVSYACKRYYILQQTEPSDRGIDSHEPRPHTAHLAVKLITVTVFGRQMFSLIVCRGPLNVNVLISRLRKPSK